MLSFLRPSGPRVERISGKDAVAQAAQGGMLLIDVRDAGELRATGKAKGALHIPMSVLALKADPKAPDTDPTLKAAFEAGTPVALYCASGGRSQMGGKTLVKLGYAKVYNIGGLADWRDGGGALER
ncbi:rhodanese-like domain-containing protein [Acidimangrovimonas sediminis]|uniref:rhodanese-like domain-containing protein n=1 Tax=Acidimangrovimonas sediminis TaxID=2056283 RepID=UPI000C7FEFB7|nr:rhodanese-like domain-containing protein [Acidimangrovimonas sediminis]